jgi:hypothetical protein
MASIGIEHGIDGGISGNIQMDGVFPGEIHGDTIPNIHIGKRELCHLVLDGVGG